MTFSIGNVSGCHDLLALASEVDECFAKDPVLVEDTLKDCAQVFWSSGTTGRPKGILHSQQSVWNMLQAQDNTNIFDVVTTLHFFHFGGYLFNIICLMSGSSLSFVST